MLEIISRDLPEAEIYVQSTLPTRPIYDPWKKVNNDHIEYFNSRIEKVCIDNNYTYIDLYSSFEKDGLLDASLTTDGIHLTPDGYKIWTDIIMKYIEEQSDKS